MLSPGLSTKRALRRATQIIVLGGLVACGLERVAAQPPLRPPPPPPTVETSLPEHYFPGLKPILEAAVRQSPQSIEGALEVTVWDARVAGSDAKRLPQLGGSFNYATEESAISGNTSTQRRSDGFFYRFELSQALFQWGALKNESARARISVAIAQKKFEEVHRLVVVSLRQSYLLLVVKKAALVQQRERHKLRVRDLESMKERQARGTVSAATVYGQSWANDDLELELQRAELEFESMRRTFSRVAGIALLKEEEIPSEVPIPIYSVELANELLTTLLRENGRSSPKVQENELEVRGADLNYRIAKVGLLPRFSAGASYSLNNSTTAANNSVQQEALEVLSFGVRGDWSIFDGFATRGRKREATASKRVAERKLASSIDEVLERAQLLERQLRVEVRANELAERRKNHAEAAVGRVQEEIKLGNTPPSAAENAEVDYNAARASSAAARATLLARWSEFISAVGADPITKNVPHVRK